jgi:predicted SAM-dependent methyltransferase
MLRDTCEICGCTDLEPIYTIENMPVRIGTSDNKNYKYFDLTYSQCAFCNNVQILNLANPFDVYEENHNKNIVGQTWVKHNKAFAEFVLNEITPDCKIFEIGDPSAKIASLIIDNTNISSWDIIEPQAEQIDIPKVKIIDGFFDKNFINDTSYDLIILSHVFEHLTNYADLIPTMDKVTKNTGKVIISIPNMQKILDTKSMPPLHMTFEHTIFLNRTNVQELFKKYNFSLKSFEKFNDHSEFYVFEKKNDLSYNFKDLMPKELSDKINEIIEEKKNKIKYFNIELNKNIYDSYFIYGSHVHSQMYLNLGLDESILNGVLDNDVAKHYRYLYGTNLQVSPVATLEGFKKPLILCDMGAYDDEIKKQINQNYPKATII